ncbi:MAG TPA: hypothetical protein VND64_08385 [Pirellulales bacterium]|nr:hypothetical protein [Pirellulales bacterium]
MKRLTGIASWIALVSLVAGSAKAADDGPLRQARQAKVRSVARTPQAISGYLFVPSPSWQYQRGGPTGYGRIGFSAYRGFGYGYNGYPRYLYRAYSPKYGYPGSWVGGGNGYPYYTYWGWGYPGFGNTPNVGGSIR